MDPILIERLVRIYGVRAAEIVRLAASESPFARLVDERHGLLVAEIIYATRTEFARTVSDVLMRRTMIGLDPDVDATQVEAVAEVMATHLRWTEARRHAEVDRYLAVASRHRPFARAASRSDPSERLAISRS